MNTKKNTENILRKQKRAKMTASMKDGCFRQMSIFWVCLLLLCHAGPTEAQIILSQGHHPMSVQYSSEGWDISIAGSHGSTDRYDVEDVIFHLTPASQLTIPGSATFSFLGEAGSPVWIAPSIENPNILQLGIGGTGIAPGVISNERLKLNLVSISGPGDFSMYTNNSQGGVNIQIASADGLSAGDSSDFSISGHDHPNWAFNAEGYYQLTWNISGALSNGTAIQSENFVTRYAVGDIEPIQSSGPVVIDEGDADIAVVVNQDTIVLEAFWGVDEMAYDHDEVIYRIKANSRILVPENPSLQFLGNPGDIVWVGPQTETEGQIYLAMAADNFPTGFVTQDKIKVSLTAFSGPGDMFVYEVDSFGTPTINFNTRDGLSEADSRDLFATDHSHLNWAFSAPGIYTIDLLATATRAADASPITSAVTRFTFEVLNPVVIDEGDADIAVVVNQDTIVLEAFWGVDEMAYDHDEVIYRIKANSRILVPENPSLQFLGNPGDIVWVGPQTETEGQIYLAMAADNFPTGFVTQDKIKVSLTAFNGPGDMFVYEVDSFGTPTINFNTRDGLSEADSRDLFASDHSHLNWAFTAPGIYTLDLKAEATRVSDSSTMVSEVTRFTFEVRDNLKLNISQINPTNIQLKWNSALNSSYQFYGREKLETGNWIPLGNSIYGNGQTQSISLPTIEFTSQFYKIIESRTNP